MDQRTLEFLDALQDESFVEASPATKNAFPRERRITGAALGRFLARRGYIVICTTRPDRRPHATMTSFVVGSNAVWIPTEAGTARVRNLRRNPYASLVLAEGEGDSHAVVLIEGTTNVATNDDVPPAVVDAWRTKLDSDPSWAEHWIVVRPAKLLSYAAQGWDVTDEEPADDF